MTVIKKYILEIIVIVIILLLIVSNIFTFNFYKIKNKSLIEYNDSLLYKLRNDSVSVKILEEANNNCVNNTQAKVSYYENKIRNINRQIDESKILMYDLQNKKNSIDDQIRGIDSTRMSPADLINFINSKY